MSPETKTCQNCKQNFTIEPDDFTFYEKMKVPAPTWCPECRLFRKTMWRSDIGFFRREDSRTKEIIFAGYPESAPIKVWEYSYWMSDKWDPLEYGREYDWNKPFFEQFGALIREIPWPSLAVEDSVSSPYCNNATSLRNSYLTFGSSYAEESFYSFGLARSKNILDSSYMTDCELGYQGVFNRKCYRSFYSNHCKDSSDIFFCKNCNNLTNCFGCVNLRNKSYCVFNESVGKERYLEFMEKAGLSSYTSVNEYLRKTFEFWIKFPEKFMSGANNNNVSGEYINNSKNVSRSFLVDGGENIKYSSFLYVGGAKDSYDHFRFSNNSELIYDCMACGSNISRLKFCFHCFPACHSMDYCASCFSSSDLFGCFGLRKKQYCILNKQYTKEEYEALVPKIIKHMNDMPYVDQKGLIYKYGEFFPSDYSPLAYNESVTLEYFPLSEREARAKGYRWGDVTDKQYKATIQIKDIPDSIDDTKDSILNEVIRCEHDGKCPHPCSTVFRIVPQELQFYRRFKIPLPHICFNCRHYERLKLWRSHNLFERICQCAGVKSENGAYQNTVAHQHGAGKCINRFETSYAPDRKEIIYCEQCYNAEVA